MLCPYQQCLLIIEGSRERGRDRTSMVLIFTFNAKHYYGYAFDPRPGEVYSIQFYVIKYISDLRKLESSGYPPSIKQSVMILVEERPFNF